MLILFLYYTPNVRNTSSNIVFPWNICEKRVNDKNAAIKCDICQTRIHLKYNKLNHIDYKYFQGLKDPWFCVYCCSTIFPFGFLTNNDFSPFLYSRNESEKCVQQKQLYPFNTSVQSSSFV